VSATSPQHDRRGAGYVERRGVTALPQPPEPRFHIGRAEAFVVGVMNGFVAGFFFAAWILL
jgi:hypothetical protein